MLAFVLSALACGRSVDVPVEIDLAAAAGAEPAGSDARGVARADGSRCLVEAGDALDRFLRLPRRSMLLFALPASFDARAVRVQVDSGRARETAILEWEGHGIWRAPLGHWDGQVVRLRLENRSGRLLTCIRPRIVGYDRLAPPILDPSFRPAARPINVILYVVDTLRADRLSLYGYERRTSPALETLAARAVVFLNAYAAGSNTMLSVPALFASRYPSELGRRLTGKGPDRHTLAEVFQAAGYRTAGFQANALLDPMLGFDRGFDQYHVLVKRAEELHERALAWLREPDPRPFFLYVQTMDVHFPYNAPAPFGEMFLPEGWPPPPPLDAPAPKDEKEALRRRFQAFEWLNPDRYDGSIAYADHEIGTFVAALDELGLRDRTAIVITSDHGEPLGQRGTRLHGSNLNEEQVRVPLVLVLPWHAGSTRVTAIVGLVDVSATLLDFAGLPVPPQFLGRSMLQPASLLHPPYALGELLRTNESNVSAWYVREGPWKVLKDQRGARLFHLPTDPAEENDVSRDYPIRAAYLETVLRERAPSLRGSVAPSRIDADLSDEQRRDLHERLRALGYVE